MTQHQIDRWNTMGIDTRKMANDRMQAQSPLVRHLPFHRRLMKSPRLWWRHFKIGCGYHKSRLQSAWFALQWTRLFLFK